MRKIIISELVTLDGVVEALGGEPGFKYTGWSADYVDQDYIQHNLSALDEVGALLLGRITYESFEGAFAELDPNNPFAMKMYELDKYVVSGTLQQVRWHKASIIDSNIVASIQQLKSQPGLPILVNGSRTLVQLLFQHDLVDELRLLVHPTILGTGKTLISEIGDRKKLVLKNVNPFASGIVALRYDVIHNDTL